MKSDLVEASELAFTRIREIQDLMSFHDPASELSHINRFAATEAIAVSADTNNVLHMALSLSEVSGGKYDVTVASYLVRSGHLPEAGGSEAYANWRAIDLKDSTVSFRERVTIDLGGIAKGYAVDQAFDVLQRLPIAFRQIVVNAGGDMRMLVWEGQRTLLRYAGLLGQKCYLPVAMHNYAFASSTPGHGSPSSHIVDPRNGRFKRGWHTYGVFAKTCMVADAMTKFVGMPPINQTVLMHFGATAFRVNAFGRKSWFAQ